MRKTVYQLEVYPRPGQQYGLSLNEVVQPAGGARREPELRPVVRLWGSPLQAVFDRVVEAVKAHGGRASDIRRERKVPFTLDEETAVRLGLLFLAVKPLRKSARIEAIRDATAIMGTEEAYYWYSKCSSSTSGRRATRAFRVLLAQE